MPATSNLSNTDSIAALNRVLATVLRSFPQYLRWSRPWVPPGHERVLEALERIVSEQDAMAERAFDAIDDLGGLPDTGEFPMEFTDTHDLSIDYMLREAVGYGQQDVAALGVGRGHQEHDAPGRAARERAPQMAKRHLATLEGLTPPRAGGVPVAILTANSCHAALRHACASGPAGFRRRSCGGHRTGSRSGRREHRSRSAPRRRRARSACGWRLSSTACPRPSACSRTTSPRPSQAIGIASSRSPRSRASWPSARRASIGTGISRRSTCSRTISIGIYGLAEERGLPFVVHMRDCDEDILVMLRDASARGPLHGVMHSFTGGQAMAEECLAMGLYISFAGMVTYKKSDELRAVAAAVPDDRILIETDCPYLSPEPVRKIKRNEPAQRKTHRGLPGGSPRCELGNVRSPNDGQRATIVFTRR